MSDLLQRRVVACPYHLAQRYLSDCIQARIGAGEAGHLALTCSLPGGGQMVREVLVTYTVSADPMQFDQPWRIHWTPKAGPYPDFDGELTVRADETYQSSLVELNGTYLPPGGLAGQAFDSVFGGRIAAATAQALLERIGTELESHYARDERGKATEQGT